MDDLRERFESIKDDYEALKRSCEAQVERWEWYSGPTFELPLLYFERHNETPGEKLPEPPADAHGKHQYGYDAQGRIAVERRGTSVPGLFFEAFRTYSDDMVEETLYNWHRDKQVINVTRRRSEKGTPISYEMCTDGREVRESYEYDGERLARINVWRWSAGDEPEESRLEISYGDDGSIETIKHFTLHESPEPIVEVLYHKGGAEPQA